MLGIDDHEARTILAKLGREIGYEHMATMARQVAHENAKPEAPTRRRKLRTVELWVDLKVKVDLYRKAKTEARSIKRTGPKEFEACGWEEEHPAELADAIADLKE